MTSKISIREAGKQKRRELNGEARRELDAGITKLAQAELDWAGYEHVMIYLPIAKQREIDTWPLIRWIWTNWPAVSVFVPRVRGEDVEAVQITPLTTYETSPKGITEPADGDALAHGEPLDLVICALLGFDERGYRVGYGGGFYDRFFMEFPAARRVGLSYESLKASYHIDAEPHDIRLHDVITEAQLHTF